MNLIKRSILITGASGGIGATLADHLAREGARLTLVARREGALQATLDRITSEGGHATGVVGDITDPVVQQRAISQALDTCGQLDMLVNNAGNVRAGRLENLSSEDIQAMINLNLITPILLTRLALPALRAGGQGAVVNISSGFGLVGGPFYQVYAATKAGLARFGESLRRELLGEGVSVHTVYPGATRTAMMESNAAGPELGFIYQTAEEVARIVVAGLLADEPDIITAPQERRTFIKLNIERPGEVDAFYAGIKDRLEEAVKDHSSL
ncbi:short chain dehydrogenase [Deinococcus malanensis]|uniref:Short chain dehydrogenase n=1 Tax=Deinococcus malanensis TaxID=1706855 RepID=A0ABQ2F5H5_9DEIO|nr:SDR family oxidoreductase [Deinococcus malanensis]GGK43686.1 short chain dehydrogenase [Deinococcus malanensis]